MMGADPNRSTPAGGASSGQSVTSRIALRREQLGLSQEEMAARAGMSVTYLRTVEELGAEFDSAALARLAAVLDLSYEELTVGRRDAPPGRGAPAARPVLVRLSEEECWTRLGTHGVGRLAYTGATGGAPVMVPVNFLVDGRSLVYRTDAAGVAAAADGTEVAFETDHLDEASGLGWSVLVAGTAEHIADDDVVAALARRPGATPWAGGRRELWIRVAPREVSGRAIRTLPEPEAP